MNYSINWNKIENMRFQLLFCEIKQLFLHDFLTAIYRIEINDHYSTQLDLRIKDGIVLAKIEKKLLTPGAREWPTIAWVKEA